MSRQSLLLLVVLILAACQPASTPVPVVLPTLMPSATHSNSVVTSAAVRSTLPPTFTPTYTYTPQGALALTATKTPLPTQTARPSRTPHPTATNIVANPTATPFVERSEAVIYDDMETEAMLKLLNDTPALYVPDPAHLPLIFERGQERDLQQDFMLGIGDCNTESRYFLHPVTNEHSSDGVADVFLARSDVQDLVSYFEPTFDQQAESANSGFNALTVFDPLWTRAEFCEAGESPLACDIREHDPFAMMVMFGANDVLVLTTEAYETALRDIIEYALAEGVIPILSTFAFDPSGYNGQNYQKSIRMNAVIRLLAEEYGVPMVNFWREVQSVPGSGILPDNAHLNVEAFEIRNQLALEMLRYLRAEVIEPFNEDESL